MRVSSLSCDVTDIRVHANAVVLFTCMLWPNFEPLTRLLTVQPDYKLVSRLLNRSESESGSISQRARLVSGSISRRGQKVGRAYAGRLGGQQSLMNRVRERE